MRRHANLEGATASFISVDHSPKNTALVFCCIEALHPGMTHGDRSPGHNPFPPSRHPKDLATHLQTNHESLTALQTETQGRKPG